MAQSPAQQERARTGYAKLAVVALVFTLILSGTLLVYTSRSIEQAKKDAIASAEHARRESVRGLCVLIANLYVNPNSSAEGRKLLDDTYTYLGCTPPLPTPPPRPRGTVSPD